MRIAVTADAHLTSTDDHPERYRAMENILSQLPDQGIGALVIAGDLFDRDFRNYSEFEALCRHYPHIQFHIIPGNHDPGISARSIVARNLSVYDAPAIVPLDGVPLLFLPYQEKTSMGEAIAESEGNLRGANWVLVGHGDYYGGSKELNAYEPGTYMPLSRSAVERYGPSAVFLGHIHKPRDLGRVHYPGSPCGLDINETGRRRLLVYDTATGEVTSRHVVSDVLYFQESLVVVPTGNEAELLEKEVARRIEAWGLDPSERARVRVRVRALGYATDKSAVLEALRCAFSGLAFYEDEEPSVEGISVSTDRQLDALAKRAIELIDGLELERGGDETGREEVVLEALRLLYGGGRRRWASGSRGYVSTGAARWRRTSSSSLLRSTSLTAATRPARPSSWRRS